MKPDEPTCNCLSCTGKVYTNIAVLTDDIVGWQIIEAPTVGKKYRVPVYRGGWMPASYGAEYEVDWNYTEETGETKA